MSCSRWLWQLAAHTYQQVQIWQIHANRDRTYMVCWRASMTCAYVKKVKRADHRERAGHPKRLNIGVCEIITLFIVGACQPPTSPIIISMFTNVRTASAIRLRNKHTFMLEGLGRLCHNFEIRGAGWPREETAWNQKVCLFRKHRYLGDWKGLDCKGGPMVLRTCGAVGACCRQAWTDVLLSFSRAAKHTEQP